MARRIINRPGLKKSKLRGTFEIRGRQSLELFVHVLLGGLLECQAGGRGRNHYLEDTSCGNDKISINLFGRPVPAARMLRDTPDLGPNKVGVTLLGQHRGSAQQMTSPGGTPCRAGERRSKRGTPLWRIT
jgi:hypothetical protein